MIHAIIRWLIQLLTPRQPARVPVTVERQLHR